MQVLTLLCLLTLARWNTNSSRMLSSLKRDWQTRLTHWLNDDYTPCSRSFIMMHSDDSLLAYSTLLGQTAVQEHNCTLKQQLLGRATTFRAFASCQCLTDSPLPIWMNGGGKQKSVPSLRWWISFFLLIIILCSRNKQDWHLLFCSP